MLRQGKLQISWFVLFCIVQTTSSFAADWDDQQTGLGDKLWSRALNWNPNLIPQTNDIVRIGNLTSASGDDTQIDTAFTIAGLELSNGASADTSGNFVDILSLIHI